MKMFKNKQKLANIADFTEREQKPWMWLGKKKVQPWAESMDLKKSFQLFHVTCFKEG